MSNLTITPEQHEQACVDINTAIKKAGDASPYPFPRELDDIKSCDCDKGCNCLAGAFIIATRFLEAVAATQCKEKQSYKIDNIELKIRELGLKRRVPASAFSLAVFHLEHKVRGCKIAVKSCSYKTDGRTKNVWAPLSIAIENVNATSNLMEIDNLVQVRKSIRQLVKQGRTAMWNLNKTGRIELWWASTLKARLATGNPHICGKPAGDFQKLSPLVDEAIILANQLQQSKERSFRALGDLLDKMESVVYFRFQESSTAFGKADPLTCATDYLNTGYYMPPMDRWTIELIGYTVTHA